jgi:hypothetical protein
VTTTLGEPTASPTSLSVSSAPPAPTSRTRSSKNQEPRNKPRQRQHHQLYPYQHQQQQYQQPISCFLDAARWNQIPCFHRSEVVTGRVVGRGGFGVVRDVTSIRLLSSGNNTTTSATTTTTTTLSSPRHPTSSSSSSWNIGISATTGCFGRGGGSEGTNTTAVSNGSGTTGSGGSFGIKAGTSGHNSSSGGRTALRLFARQTSKDRDNINSNEPTTRAAAAAAAAASGDAAAAAAAVANKSSHHTVNSSGGRATTTTTTITREQLARRVWDNKKKKGGKYVLKEVEFVHQDGTQTHAAEQTYMKGTMDLALEARILASLSHPYILELRGLAASPASATTAAIESNNSKVHTSTEHNNNYFIIIDKLQETLPKRLNAWMHRDRACKGITGALTSFGAKNRRKELLMDRILVAHDIASAMCYLHGKNIIYVSVVCFCFSWCFAFRGVLFGRRPTASKG